ncbi:MAG: hypothetical protein VX938_08605, partial [Myxococcota bacterium]|nr:hypothetical protein [Myxococcota bacterium]
GNCNNNCNNDGGYWCENHNIDGCTICTPACDGKACGADDDCGGTCEEGSGCIQEGGGSTFTDDVQPIFDEFCGGCHSDSSPDPMNCYGDRCFASHYEANKMESNHCDGETTGACTLIRINDGSMPMGMGGPPAIVPDLERDIIDDWILSGMPE